MEIFEKEKIDVVINLAAQAGVRYSLTNPDAYITANIQSFLNIPGSLSCVSCQAFGVCFFQFCIWCQYQNALFDF
jgi:UDP-glucose 4-epimerase